MTLSTLRLLPNVEQSGNVRVITLSGNKVRDVVNMVARDLEDRTDRLDGGYVLLDFSNVEQFSSAELGTLVSLHSRMRSSGGRLLLFNLSDQIYEVFTATRLQTVLEICRDEGTTPGGDYPGVVKDEGRRASRTLTVCSVGDPEKFVNSE